jgi:ubiquinone/menaquinone biosynthesis C-methylase UbiE
MAILPDYSTQALTYDSTRGASPSVLAPLRDALRGAPGRSLLDSGGGTGNYAQALRDEGWQPIVLDRSAAMLQRAAAKGLPTVVGDALALPFDDGSFDAVMLVSMLHHTGDPQRALAEARRVLRRGGRLAVMVFTREDIADQWYRDYFPSADAWMIPSHPSIADLLRDLPGAEVAAVRYTDMLDGSMAALLAHPQLILDRRWRAQTSFFERMERDHPDELRHGLERLAADITAGNPPRGGPGGATMIAWGKPA